MMPTNQSIVGEVLQKRTKNSKHYLLMDGSYQANVYPYDIHYEDEMGILHNNDTGLFDEADFDQIVDPISKDQATDFKTRKNNIIDLKKKNALDRSKFDFHSLKVPFDVTVPRNFKKGYSIGKGADRLTFKPVGASPSQGHVDTDRTNAIVYQDPWNDVDVCLELTDVGIKETLTLKSNLAPTKFTFEVTGPLASDFTSGTLKIQPAWLQDANGVKRDVTQTIRTDATTGKTYIDLVADVTGLAYPIIIDPTTTIQPVSNNYLYYDTRSGSTSSYVNATFQIGKNPNDNNVTRGLLGVDLSSIPANAAISSAVLSLLTTSQYSTSATISCYRVTQAWPNPVTAATQPANDATAAATITVDNATGIWRDFTITTLAQQWLNGTYTNYGLKFINADEVNASARTYASPGDTTATNRPKLTVTYTQPPTAPTVTAPNGGETIDTSYTITWTAATDPDTAQASIQYQIQLSTDNGATWADILVLTAAGVTSYVADFSAKAETTTALVRIRGYDGTSYGPWDQSNAVFTIKHNVAPTAPTNLSPASGAVVDRALTQRLSWTHNDTDLQPQSKLDLQYSLDNGTTWTTITQTTTNQYWDAPPNTFTHGNDLWKVRTYDQGGLVGPYSAQATFLAGDKPALPTITSPVNNGTVSVARPVIQWSSVGQVDYQVQIKQAATVTWDSSDVINGNKAVTVGVDLANTIVYSANVRIKNSDGLWSDYATNTFTVSYTPPATPTLTAISSTDHISIAITNPVPSGSQPTISSNDVYRRESGKTVWTRIATGVAVNGTYSDYTTSSGIAYEYKVTTIGSNGTVADSATVSTSIIFTGVWLHDVADPAGTIYRFRFDGNGKNTDWKAEVTMMQFAGRSRPVAEFGESGVGKMSAQLQMLKGDQDYTKLQSLVQRKGTVCYRDGRGRKMFGIISELPFKDERYGYTTTIDVTETSYLEGV